MITKQVMDVYGKNITLEVLDARTIVLTTTVSAVAQYPASSNRPTELQIGDDIYIDIHSTFKQFIFTLWENGPKLVYNIKTIIKIDTGKYMLHTHDRTVSSYFLPPMLGFDKNWFEWNRYFINAYFVKLSQSGKYKYTNGTDYVIGLLFRFIPTDDFKAFEQKLKKHAMFLFHYDMDYQTSLMIFAVPHMFTKDFKLISESKYSQLGDLLKSMILKFHGFPKDGEMDQVLNRSKVRQQKLEIELGGEIPDGIDLLDRIDFSKELITINEY